MNATPHLIAGRYEVGELLGRGGMAEVRKGTDIRLGRTVAIKRLRTELATDPVFQTRFRREAKSSAALNHPSIVAVYDTGEEWTVDAHTGEQVAQPYIVMEYVAGRTLRDILRDGRKILPERALEISADVLSALAYSHRMGIIHRDIKPANVMLTPTGDVKVMDFGIARALADHTSSVTQTSAVVGTAQYLSPEQARGDNVDVRSDVYSAGCLMYELLAGRPPFIADTPVAVAYQHVREIPLPPSSYDDELTPEMDAIALKALAKDRADRYQSADEMRADIERLLAGQPISAVAAAAATTTIPTAAAEATTTLPPAPAASPLPPTTDPEPDEPRRRTGLWVLLSLLLIAALAAAAILLPKLLDPGTPQVSVPDVTNMNQVRAETKLTQAGLRLGNTEEQASDTVKAGDVISQDPVAGQTVDQGTEVNLVISSGKPDVAVPDVVGKDRATAQSELGAVGLRAKFVVRESDAPADQVLETDPPAGTMVTANKRVTVYVSDGPETVPNVEGMDQAAAEAAITKAGFVPSVITDPNSTEPAGTVIKQSPSAGTTQPAGTEITIVVSAAPTEEPTPTETPTP